MARTCAVDLTCDLAAPRAARDVTRLVLLQWGVTAPDAVDAATLVVSELVTNALVHCDDAGPLTLGLELAATALTVWVADGAPTIPAQRAALPGDLDGDPDGDLAEGGRGLSIVAQLAERWEVEPQQAGKRVVAVLPVATVECA
jgi:anti-sigma regulatory factor (Ser/Thr protein kinase)